MIQSPLSTAASKFTSAYKSSQFEIGTHQKSGSAYINEEDQKATHNDSVKGEAGPQGFLSLMKSVDATPIQPSKLLFPLLKKEPETVGSQQSSNPMMDRM